MNSLNILNWQPLSVSQCQWSLLVFSQVRKKESRKKMYQVKVYNRQTNEVIMESDTFQTLPEADAMLATVGSGEGYYSIVFKLDAVWSDLVPA